MKKVVTISILSLLFLLVLGAWTSSAKENDIDALLAPYQKVINRVNAKLGSTFFILRNTKEQVYNKINNLSPDEFARLLTYEYKTFPLDPSSKNHWIEDDATKKPAGSPRLKPYDGHPIKILPLDQPSYQSTRK